MNYAKSIFVFGFLFTILLGGIVAGGVLFGLSKVSSTAEERKAIYDKMLEDEAKATALEQKVLPYRGAVAYFERQSKVKIDEKLPILVDGLCDTKLNGQIFKTGMSFTQGRAGEVSGSSMEFTTRYEALEKAISEIEATFPYLKITAVEMGVKGATTSLPSPHLEVKVVASVDKAAEKKAPVIEPIK